jgi:hypothetical protein
MYNKVKVCCVYRCPRHGVPENKSFPVLSHQVNGFLCDTADVVSGMGKWKLLSSDSVMCIAAYCPAPT